MPYQASNNSLAGRRPVQSKYHVHDDGVAKVQEQSRDKAYAAARAGNAISDFSM
jgi:hypothetical protein